MPGFDRTGPEGEGPKTGRGEGLCDDDNTKILPKNRGLGLGLGLGRGRGRGLGRGRGRGLGRGIDRKRSGIKAVSAEDVLDKIRNLLNEV